MADQGVCEPWAGASGDMAWTVEPGTPPCAGQGGEPVTFSAIATADRLVLSNWLDHAVAAGIADSAIDLAPRPWKVAGANAVIGVFESKKHQASWLIVRCGPQWAMARCSDGFTSGASTSLTEILNLIDEDRRV